MISEARPRTVATLRKVTFQLAELGEFLAASVPAAVCWKNVWITLTPIKPGLGSITTVQHGQVVIIGWSCKLFIFVGILEGNLGCVV